MFSSQARECGVNISVKNANSTIKNGSALVETDITVMDKFKMDQVYIYIHI
jgi:hypothetical protein